MEKIDEAVELAVEASSADREATQPSTIPAQAYPPATTDSLTSGTMAPQEPFVSKNGSFATGKSYGLAVCYLCLYLWENGIVNILQ